MSMSMSSCLFYACTRQIKKSSKIKGDIAYTDAWLKVVPRMNDVIELLISAVPEDQLGEVYDVVEQMNFRPALFSECTEEDIHGRKNDWIDILEELEKVKS